MKAIILAAGMASRLRPLTDHKPKCLLEIGKQCLLGRAIEGLIFNGIREVIPARTNHRIRSATLP